MPNAGDDAKGGGDFCEQTEAPSLKTAQNAGMTLGARRLSVTACRATNATTQRFSVSVFTEVCNNIKKNRLVVMVVLSIRGLCTYTPAAAAGTSDALPPHVSPPRARPRSPAPTAPSRARSPATASAFRATHREPG